VDFDAIAGQQGFFGDDCELSEKDPSENFFGWNPKGSVWNRRFHMRAPARMTWHAKGGPAPETAHYF
jgi:hypothetical protein